MRITLMRNLRIPTWIRIPLFKGHRQLDPQPRHVTQNTPLCRAADPHHFNAEFTDPDLDTDPLFHFYADPDPGTHQSDVNL